MVASVHAIESFMPMDCAASRHSPNPQPNPQKLGVNIESTIDVDFVDLAVDSAVESDAEPVLFSYRPDIDGLRSFAVLAVVLFHIDESWLPGGFVGVDIFFVISGYVVAASILKHPSDAVSTFFLSFYARRFKRLMPSLAGMLSVAGLLVAIFVPPWNAEYVNIFHSGVYACFGLSNNYFASFDVDNEGYFRSDGLGVKMNVFLHTWSLGIEEQFYLLCPLLLYVVHRGGQGNSQVDTARRVLVMLGSTISISMLISAFQSYNVWSGTDQQTVGFYCLPSRFWELMLGVALAEAQLLGCPIFPPYASTSPQVSFIAQILIEVIAAALLLISITVTKSGEGFPFPYAHIATTGTVLFILAGNNPLAYLNRGFGMWPLPYIGKLSYPIYLWHWPLIVIIKWSEYNFDTLGGRAAVVGLTVGCSLVSYHAIEYYPRKWSPKGQYCTIYAFFLTLMGLVTLWLLLLCGPLKGQLYETASVDVEPIQLTQNSSKIQLTQNSSNASHLVQSKCMCSLHSASLYHPHSAAQGVSADSCFTYKGPPYYSTMFGALNKAEAIMQANRLLPQRLSPQQRNIFLIGDSHAADLLNPVRTVAAKGGFSFSTWPVGYGYGFIPDSYDTWYVDKVLQIFTEHLQPGDIVCISQHWGHFATEWGNLGHSMGRSTIAEYRQLLQQLSCVVANKSASIVHFADRAQLPSLGTTCQQTNNWGICEMPVSTMLAQTQPLRDMLDGLAGDAKYPNFHVWWYAELLCTSISCGARIPGSGTQGVYDYHHLTTVASMYLWPFLCDFMSATLNSTFSAQP